jgi:hypothetical protein
MLNDPINGDDARDQLEMGIERQNHCADSLGAFRDQASIAGTTAP